MLQQRGHQVNPAYNFRTARKLAEANTYDLVISDIELPDGSGLDLIRELTIRRPTPGIALSGFGTADDVAMSLQAGFTEHLTKPIDVRKLDEAIRRVANTRVLISAKSSRNRRRFRSQRRRLATLAWAACRALPNRAVTTVTFLKRSGGETGSISHIAEQQPH